MKNPKYRPTRCWNFNSEWRPNVLLSYLSV